MKSRAITTPLSSEDVYLVLDDFGALGRTYRESGEDEADRETLLRQMMEGQFNAPVCVIAFNLAEGWVRDVSADVAVEIDCRARRDWLELSPNVARFVERQLELGRQCKDQGSAPLPFGASSASTPALASKLVLNIS